MVFLTVCIFFQYRPTEVDKEYPLDTDTPNNLIDEQSKKPCKAYTIYILVFSNRVRCHKSHTKWYSLFFKDLEEQQLYQIKILGQKASYYQRTAVQE